MKFSVIIPTYNRTRLLMDRAIPSVLAQTVDDWECLVVGDGTEPETAIEMANLISRDSRFAFWNLPHYDYPEDFTKRWGLIGLASLNWGLDHARGDWIAVLADDDEWPRDHLEVLYTAALESGADHVYGVSDTYKNGKRTGQLYGGWPPGDGQLGNGANIYKRSLNYRYDLTCVDRGLPGDADLWTRMYRDGVKFHFVPKIVLKYHRNWP